MQHARKIFVELILEDYILFKVFFSQPFKAMLKLKPEHRKGPSCDRKTLSSKQKEMKIKNLIKSFLLLEEDCKIEGLCIRKTVFLIT